MTEIEANLVHADKLAAFCESCTNADCFGRGCPEYKAYIRSLDAQAAGVTVKVKRKYEYKGRMLGVAELARIAGVSHNTMYDRLHRRGWSAEQAVETPKQIHRGHEEKRYEFRGEMLTAGEISAITGINELTIQSRARDGRPLDAPLMRNFGRELAK